MSYLSENIIPGKMGKTFFTDINDQDLHIVLRVLNKIRGIGRVDFSDKIFPHEITVHTAGPVAIQEIQDRIKNVGFHAVPKSFLCL